MKRPVVFVELYAGLASVSLHLFGYKPPVSRIGSKAGYAAAIVKEMGLEGVRPDKVILVEQDLAVVNVLRALTSPQGRKFLVEDLRSAVPTRDLWEHWRKSRFRDPYEDAARWLLVTAGSRGGVGGFKGSHKLRPNVDGFIPSIPSLIRRIEAMQIEEGVFEVRDSFAWWQNPIKDSYVYLDPPYEGATGYGAVTAESEFTVPVSSLPVSLIAEKWAKVAHVVAVSERKRKLLPWRVVDLTKRRKGQARISLTRSTRELLYVSARSDR